MSFAVIFYGLSKNVYTKSPLSVTVPTNLVQLCSLSRAAFVHRPAWLISSVSMCCAPRTQHKQLLPQKLPSQLTVIRWANFFNKHSSEELWKGVISVSKYGAKKGRGRGTGRKLAKNLNRGQILGVGDINMVWPGLNAPVVRGQEVVQRQLLEPDPTRQQRLQQLRDNLGQLRHKTINPLERGWSGTKMGGRKMGLPDPIGDETFEGFETICLEFKVVCHMDGKLGRVRSTSVFCVAGNGNGLAGFGLAKAAKPQSAIRVAKNRAVQKLVHVPLYNGHTVLHDFYTQFGITKLFVHKMPEGSGLVCHRAIRAICEVIGIKDLYAKIEGSVHVQNLTKAFFLGLMRQKSYSQLATEKGLHVVETRAEQYNYPTVLASPVRTRSLDDIPPNENTDFTIHVLDGRVPLLKKKSESFITRTKGWEKHLKKYMVFRNNNQVRKELIKAYGVPRSFLYDKYPECIRDYYASKKKVIEEDD